MYTTRQATKVENVIMYVVLANNLTASAQHFGKVMRITVKNSIIYINNVGRLG